MLITFTKSYKSSYCKMLKLMTTTDVFS